jgi:hypothetical protein
LLFIHTHRSGTLAPRQATRKSTAAAEKEACMAQRVNYAVIPNTPEKSYLTTINKVLGYVARNPANFKDFREWLRENQLWDRDQTPIALELMGVSLKPQLGLTELGSQLYRAEGEPGQRMALFKAFRDRNTLLCKFVLEALDPESGGRLHSTYELHRMLTSYVYPGKQISLPDFQSWIKWMSACDGIRLIGIRWGLGALGKEHIEWFKSRDADEILEDDAEEEEMGGGFDEAVAEVAGAAAPPKVVAAPPAPAPAAKSGPAVVAPKAPARPAAPQPAAPVEVDEVPDMPPEASPPEDAAVERYLEKLTESEQPVLKAPAANPGAVAAAAARASRPMGAAVPAQGLPGGVVQPRPYAFGAGAPARLAPVELGADALAETTSWIRQWWAGWPNKKPVGFAEMGLDPAATKEPLVALGATAAAAIAVSEAHAPRWVAEYWGRLSKSGVVEAYFRGELELEAVVARAEALAEGPGHARLLEALVHLPGLRERLRRHADDLERMVREQQSGRAVAATLHTEVFMARFSLAPFWMLRELILSGYWSATPLDVAGVVPTYALRENAYRLGYIDALYAEGFDSLASVSEAVAAHFGRADGFDAPLSTLPAHLGCAFFCGRVYVCPLTCREKSGR